MGFLPFALWCKIILCIELCYFVYGITYTVGLKGFTVLPPKALFIQRHVSSTNSLSLSLSHCMCLTGHDKYLSQILSYCPSLSLTFPSVARLLHNKPIYTLPNTNAHHKPLLDKNALSLSLSLSFSLGISNKKFPTCSMSLSFWIPLPLLPPLPRFQCIWSPCCLAEKRVRPKRKK